MPFDWQTILAALGGRQPGALGPGGPITGTQQGGPMGQPIQPMAQMAPSSMTPQQGGGAGLLGAGGGGLGLLGAGAAMLNASGPSATPTGFGKSLGQGLSGFVQGSMADRDLAFQQKQQDSLAQIANIIARQGMGSGAAGGQSQGRQPVMLNPMAGGGPGNVTTLPSGAPGIPNFMAGAMPGAMGAPPQLPPNATGTAVSPGMPQGGMPSMLQGMPARFGMPSGGSPGAMGGQIPMGFPGLGGGQYAQQGQNPFLAMMLARRQQGMA